MARFDRKEWHYQTEIHIENNYKQIKADVEQIIKVEKYRIENDEKLQHLVKKKRK